jgi:hypothetical protein
MKARMRFIADPQQSRTTKEFVAAQAAADNLGLQIRYYPVHSEAELETALSDIARARYDAILVFRRWISRKALLVASPRFPRSNAFLQWMAGRAFAREGNLMTYGPVLEAAIGASPFTLTR